MGQARRSYHQLRITAAEVQPWIDTTAKYAGFPTFKADERIYTASISHRSLRYGEVSASSGSEQQIVLEDREPGAKDTVPQQRVPVPSYPAWVSGLRSRSCSAAKRAIRDTAISPR